MKCQVKTLLNQLHIMSRLSSNTLLVLFGVIHYSDSIPRIFDGIPVPPDSPLLKHHVSIMVTIVGQQFPASNGGATLVTKLYVENVKQNGC